LRFGLIPAGLHGLAVRWLLVGQGQEILVKAVVAAVVAALLMVGVLMLVPVQLLVPVLAGLVVFVLLVVIRQVLVELEPEPALMLVLVSSLLMSCSVDPLKTKGTPLAA
jgi:hypothetical protein